MYLPFLLVVVFALVSGGLCHTVCKNTRLVESEPTVFVYDDVVVDIENCELVNISLWVEAPRSISVGNSSFSGSLAPAIGTKTASWYDTRLILHNVSYYQPKTSYHGCTVVIHHSCIEEPDSCPNFFLWFPGGTAKLIGF